MSQTVFCVGTVYEAGPEDSRTGSFEGKMDIFTLSFQCQLDWAVVPRHGICCICDQSV